MSEDYTDPMAKARELNLKSDLAAAEARARRAEACNHILIAAYAGGVSPETMPDLIRRATDEGWTMDDKRQPVHPDKVSPKDWINGLRHSAKHFFGATGGQAFSGGDAQGQAGVSISPTGRNPWGKDTWDNMEQVRIYKEDPAKAAALAKQAGSYIGALPPDMQNRRAG